MTTATTHHNTDRGNAHCHCPAGADHGNLPMAERITVLRTLLRRHEIALVSDARGTLVVPADIRQTPAVRRTLAAYGIEARHYSAALDGVRGLYVAAESFNR